MSKLNEAADYMEKHGKATGMYRNSATGEVCAIGALRMVYVGKVDAGVYPQEYLKDRKCLENWLKRNLNLVPIEVVNWSDSSTEEAVIAGMREAAKECDTNG